ncbi:hypothetical protein MANES_10G055666v8 [Manihot esculenta]|uniref:Uncharacterized protein n=1 Tax=Manihot esculenta TaxID=3983 RepID=A0ACB7GZP7_MANES|nr:hypothetical protein MANES_10G055666v8 [Manihot esculenta]
MGRKTRPFRLRDPFIVAGQATFGGRTCLRMHAMFGGRTWTSLTYAFGGLRHTRNACMFDGRTWVFLQGYFHTKLIFLFT